MESLERLNLEDALVSFYRGKRVFVTGHTGFKGMWLCRILLLLGADVTGYALASPTPEGADIFRAAVEPDIHSCVGDIRDRAALQKAFSEAAPDIVLHLAAQPIVLASYQHPAETYETNVMGTVNLLECVRQSDTVRSFLNVTTDKVYDNQEWCWGYRETDALDGFDPYSNSKSCSELVTHSYRKSFLASVGVSVSTARAGNVIGGGDFSVDRIIPDCIRAATAKRPIELRNPASVRPYQHVLEPLMAYLQIAMAQAQQSELAGSYNVGPDESDCVTTGELADLFCKAWGEGATWQSTADAGRRPHEAGFLRLDCSKLKQTLSWRPRWHIDTAVEKTVAWTKAWQQGESAANLMDAQIRDFFTQDGRA